MKKTIVCMSMLALLMLASCSTTIPMSVNLSNQILLSAKNKNLKANYSLQTNLEDGYITYVNVTNGGQYSASNSTYIYATATAFRKMFDTYFQNRFNVYSKNEIDVTITLDDLYLRQRSASSPGSELLTGTSKYIIDAIGSFRVVVKYQGETYETKFEIEESDYNELQEGMIGDKYYQQPLVNPTQQRSRVLESCFNKAVIRVEKFIESITEQ